VILTIGTSNNAKAQCVMDCVDPFTVALDFPCDDVILDEMLLMTNIMNCSGPYTVEITDAQNNSLGNTVTSSMIGQSFTYTVTSVNDAVSCTAVLIVEDAQMPLFTCPSDVTLNCTVPIDSVLLLQDADVSDCSSFTIMFNDVEDNNFNCQDNFTQQVARNYLVEDEYNNLNSNCTQTISFVRPSVTTVVFPGDILDDDGLLCPNPDTTVANTGRPTINDIPLDNNATCDIVTTYSDAIAPTCDGGYLLIRTWVVENVCTNETAMDDQLINVIDTVPPVIIPPADFTVDADKVGCLADVTIPAASVSDACSGSIIVTTQGSFGLINGNGGQVSDLGLGDYVVSFTATDDCNNPSTATMTFTVADLSPPEILCDLHRIVAVNNLGYGEIQASSFDAGSFDLCGGLYYKAKRMVVPQEDCTTDDNPGYLFDDDLRMCCTDIQNNNIMVIVRIYDQDPGPGPVADDVLTGRYTECMVEVEVQDQIAPTIACPTNVVIDCHEDYTDLSVYGTATANDNCAIADFSEQVDNSIDECGTGTITRTFTVIDEVGFIRQCEQTITVENQNPFDGENPAMLDWPDPVIIEGCDPNTNTEPEVTGFPEILDDQCALIGTSRKDEIFLTVPDACFKILRKWTIIDWCQYDSEADDPYTAENGYWAYTQIIKIIDTEDPVLSGQNDTVVNNISGTCSAIDVQLEGIISDDCTPQNEMGFSYTVDLYSDNIIDRYLDGNNASGSYPNGIHEIVFTAEDHCNNEGTFSFTVEVVDNKSPNAVVLNGLAVDLMNMGNGVGMIEIDASSFDAGSSDNCTSASALTYSFSADANQTTMIFDCGDVGIQDVFIYVTDEAGNQSITSTYIIIQDNDQFCEELDAPGVQITGLIMDTNDNLVPSTMVQTSNQSMSVESEISENGTYQFTDITTGYQYDVTPSNNNNPLEGISSLDLLLIQKHILNIEPLDHPYKIIAADVNNSKNISATDLVELQKVLLQLKSDFTNNKSWRFIYSNYEFQNPQNPLLEDFSESYDINYLVEDMNIDFTGIKTGDVNNSANLNLSSLVETRTENRINLNCSDLILEKGIEYEVKLLIEEKMPATGFQFELSYNNSKLDILSLEAPYISNFGTNNYNIIRERSSSLLTSWIDYTDQIELQLSLKFKAKQNGRLSDFISISEEFLKPEIYTKSGEAYALSLRFISEDIEDDFILYQNSPNPSTSITTIPVKVNKDGQFILEIMDVNGRVLISQSKYLGVGDHSFEISFPGNQPGVYIYKLSSRGNFRAKRMIIAH
jgi:hypothetical protein